MTLSFFLRREPSLFLATAEMRLNLFLFFDPSKESLTSFLVQISAWAKSGKCVGAFFEFTDQIRN